MRAFDIDASHRRLPTVSTVLTAYKNVLVRPSRLLTIAAVPAAICFALAVGFFSAPLQVRAFMPLFFLTYLAPMSYLALAWSASSLWRQRPALLPSRPWMTPSLKTLACYCFWAASLYLWPVLPLSAGLLVYTAVAGGANFSSFVSYIPLSWLCLVVVGVALFARLFLALPLIAAQRPASPLAAWRLGASLGVQLGAAMFVLTLTVLGMAVLCLFLLSELILGLLMWVALDPALHDQDFLRYQIQFHVAFGVVIPIGSVLGTAVFAETMVLAFRAASNWSGFRESILERFD